MRLPYNTYVRPDGWELKKQRVSAVRHSDCAHAPRQSVERSHTSQNNPQGSQLSRVAEALDLSAPAACCARILPFRIKMLTPPNRGQAEVAELLAKLNRRAVKGRHL